MNKYLKVTTIILIICNFLMIVKVLQYKGINEELHQSIINYGPNYHETINEIKIRDSLSIINSDIYVKELSTIKGKDESVIFVFSESNCRPCLEQELAIVSELTKKNPFIILADYSNQRLLKQLMKNYKIDCPVVIKETPLPIDSKNIPYYLSLDENSIIKQTFVPIKSRTDISKQYINLKKTDYEKK